MKILPSLIDLSFLRLHMLGYREIAWAYAILLWLAKRFHVSFIVSNKHKENYPVI